MRELVQAIPDPDVLLALEPEELGAKILFLLKKHVRPGEIRMQVLFHGLKPDPTRGHPGYGNQKQEAIERAILEAWSWLENQGFLVPKEGMNGQAGWRWKAYPVVPGFAGMRVLRAA